MKGLNRIENLLAPAIVLILGVILWTRHAQARAKEARSFRAEDAAWLFLPPRSR